MAAERGWLCRLLELPGWPLWRVGVALVLSGSVIFLFQSLLLWRLPLFLSDPDVLDNVRVAITHIVITAYLLVAYAYTQQSTDRTIARVRADLASAHPAPGHRYSGRERMALAVSVLMGVLWSLLVNANVAPGDVGVRPDTWTPEVAWHRVLGFAMAILTARLFVVWVVEASRLSALAESVRDLDLLSLDAVEPFVRQGLTYALLVIGLASVFALFLVDLRYLRLFVLILVGTVPVGLVALLLPLRGIRARIIEAKRSELAWCRSEMKSRRARLGGGAAGEAGADLDELVAWEARIQAVREWPIDFSTTTRFLVYLLLPLGSWAGGALVERAIDTLLD